MNHNYLIFFTGAVAGITNVANPISVARLVMDVTPHIFIAGKGAAEFAFGNGVPFIDSEELITDYARKALEDFLHGKGEPTNELGYPIKVLSITKCSLIKIFDNL